MLFDTGPKQRAKRATVPATKWFYVQRSFDRISTAKYQGMYQDDRIPFETRAEAEAYIIERAAKKIELAKAEVKHCERRLKALKKKFGVTEP